MAICYLVGAGAFTMRGLYPAKEDCVIAADGGYSSLQSAGIVPDLLVGDFDSLQWIPRDIPQKMFPPEKDETDMELALAEGIARGYQTFYFYGANGGRADHTLANLQLLGSTSRQSFTCRMVCPKYDVYAITDETLRLAPITGGSIVSVFCHGDRAEGVTLEGLKYPLRQAVLTCDHPLGVSNETTGEEISITVGSGTLLVYVMRQEAMPVQ